MEQKMEDLIKSQLPSDETELANFVVNAYTSAKDATSELRLTKWPKFYNTFIQALEDNGKYPYRSKIYIPLILSQIQVLTPYLMETIFSSDPAFKIKDTTGLDPMQKQALEKVIDCQLDKTNMYSRLEEFIISMQIYGTAIAKVYWDKESRMTKAIREIEKPVYEKIEGIDFLKETKIVEEEYDEELIDFEGPVFAPIDLKDFFVDPKATKLDGFWKGHLVEKNYSEMVKANKKANGKLYKNLDVLKALLLAGDISSGVSEEEDQKNRDLNKLGIVPDTVTPKGAVRLFEYWSADNKRVITVAIDQGVIIRDSKNPYEHGKSPFVAGTFFKVPGSFYGVGLAESIYGLQMNVNTITNQRNDNINLVLNRMWKYKLGTAMNINKLRSAPGNLIGVENMEDVESFETKDVTQSAYMEVANNKSEAQELLGTRYISGTNSSGSNRTATGVRLNQNAEANRVQGIFRRLEDTVLKPFINMVIALNYQFNDSESVMEVIGQDGQTINFAVTNDLYSKQRTFYAAGIRTVMQRDVQVHQMENFLSILTRMPPQMIMAYGINIQEILRRIWEYMDLDDSNKIIGGPASADATAERAAQYAMMQMMSEQAGSAMGQGLTPPTPGNTMSAGNIAGGPQ